MNADPNDLNAQKRIEEEINKALVQKNFETAMEYNPEFYSQVTMLYIQVKVNGVHL